VVRAWAAYVEDRALVWSDPSAPEPAPLEEEVRHVVAALDALLAVPAPRPGE